VALIEAVQLRARVAAWVDPDRDSSR